MSIPISECLQYKAALGDEVAYNRLLEIYEVNIKCGHWSTISCSCNPPCTLPTQEQIDELNERTEKYFAENPVKRDQSL